MSHSSHDLDREILNRTPDNQPPPLQPGDMQVPEYMDDGDARVAGRSDLQDQEFAFPTKGVYKTIPPQISPARKEVAMMFSSIDRHTNADMPIDMTLSTYQAMHDRYHQVVQRVQSMRLFDDPMAAEAAIELNKQLNDECVFIRQMEDPLTQRTMFLYACDEKRAPCLSLSMSAHGLEAFQWIEPRKRVVSHFHKRSNDNDLC